MTAQQLRVLSYGGGTQSAALALMSAAGELPRLDAVIMADTLGELPETYAYRDYVRDQLDAAGIPFEVVSAGDLEADLLAETRRPGTNPTPPAHIENADGSAGKVAGYRCSFDYKRRPVTRRVKQLCGGPGAWKRATVEQWLGFSVDEVGRCKPDLECRCGHNRTRPDRADGSPRGHVPACTDCGCERFDPWRVNVFPLIELGYRRSDTIAWFARNGHPTPPRSACWFCPNSGPARWQQLRDRHPDLFERACRIDEAIRDGGSCMTIDGKAFLHGARIPLRSADLRTAAQRQVDAGQGELFDAGALAGDCEAGVCFT